MRKFFKICFVVAGVFVGLLLIALAAAAIIIPRKYPPEKLKAMAADKLSETLNRKVTLGDVRFELLKGFEIKDLKIANRQGWNSSPFISAENISISYHLFPLLWGQVSLGEISLDKPQILVERKSLDDFNFSDMSKTASSDSNASAPADNSSQEAGAAGPGAKKPTKTLLLVTVDGFSVKHGKVIYLDERYEPLQRSDLADLNLSVKNISLLGQKTKFSLDTPFNYQKMSYRLTIAGSGRYFLGAQTIRDLEVKGSVNDTAFEISGALKNITTAFAPELKGSASLEMIKASGLIPASVFAMPEGLSMSGTAKIAFNLGGNVKEGLEFSGMADGKDLNLSYKDLFLKEAKTPFKIDFKSVVGTGYYNIPSFHAVFQDWEAEGALRHKDGGASTFELHTKALPLKGISRAVPRFKNVGFEGTVGTDVTAFEPTSDSKSLKLNGQVVFNGVGMFPPNEPRFLENITGTAAFKESSLQVPKMTFKILDGTGAAALNLNFGAKPVAYAYSLSVTKADARQAINGSVDLFVTKDQADYKDKLFGTVNLVYQGTGRGFTSEQMAASAVGNGKYSIKSAKIKGYAFIKFVNKLAKDQSDEIVFDQIDGTLMAKNKVLSFNADTTGKLGKIHAVGGVDMDGNWSPDMKMACDIQKDQLNSDALKANLPAEMRDKWDVSRAADAKGYVPLDFRFTGPVKKYPGIESVDLTRLVNNLVASYSKDLQKTVQEEGKKLLKGLFGK